MNQERENRWEYVQVAAYNEQGYGPWTRACVTFYKTGRQDLDPDIVFSYMAQLGETGWEMVNCAVGQGNTMYWTFKSPLR